MRARQGEIRWCVVSPMLSGSNMFDVETDHHGMLLWQQAIFAPVAGPLAHELAYGISH